MRKRKEWENTSWIAMKLHWEETNGFQLLVVVAGARCTYVVCLRTMFDTDLTSSVCKQICMLVLTTCLDMCFAYAISLFCSAMCGRAFIYILIVVKLNKKQFCSIGTMSLCCSQRSAEWFALAPKSCHWCYCRFYYFIANVKCNAAIITSAAAAKFIRIKLLNNGPFSTGF